MGRKIITNHKDSWKLYSTIVDDVIVEYTTEKELKNHIAKEIIYEAKIKAIKELMCFPDRWMVNGKLIFTNNDKGRECLEWQDSILISGIEYDEYYKLIDDKLGELMNQ